MGRKKSTEVSVSDETQQNLAEQPEGGSEPAEFTPPPRSSNDVLPHVKSIAQTITGCSDNEMKNFLATGDYLAKRVVLQLGEMWKGICKTARKAGEEDQKAAKVSLTVKIEVDHTNLLMMDTKCSMGYSEKHGVSDETQEDLTQVQFDIAVGE